MTLAFSPPDYCIDLAEEAWRGGNDYGVQKHAEPSSWCVSLFGKYLRLLRMERSKRRQRGPQLQQRGTPKGSQAALFLDHIVILQATPVVGQLEHRV